MIKEAQPNEKLVLVDVSGNPSKEFRGIFDRYYAALCYFAERITMDDGDAKDIVSGVFASMLGLPKEFENEKHVRAFLYKSVRNACLNHLKLSERARMREGIYLTLLDEDDEAALNHLIRTEVLREIYLEIGRLPEQCRKIISMSFFDGLKNEEIAKELELSVQTVKNQKTRGLSLLRMRLSPELFMLLLLLNSIH